MNFDKELEKGFQTYDQKVGEWWSKQANNRAHTIAYNNIAKTLAKWLPHTQSIIDYACGNGRCLEKVKVLLPQAKIVGIDGSAILLKQAKGMIIKQSYLPNFDLKERAEVVLFTFPNLVYTQEDQPYLEDHGYLHKEDQKVARAIAQLPEEDEEDDEDTIVDDLLTQKVVSRNIHQLIKQGGYCVRVIYSTAARNEITKKALLSTAFEEGSLDTPIKGVKPEQLFKLEKSIFFNSKVIEDVYHQTENKDDNEGGYFISLLKKI